jgi:hypothetical protein
MVLEQEAIELHKLSKVIESNKGFILDLSTDCISCVFPNEFPLQVDENNNIKNYYYDINKEFPRYKLEKNPKVLDYKFKDYQTILGRISSLSAM